jgi:hypothetical protein
VWKRVGSILRFCLDEASHLVLDSSCFATGEKLKYLLGILNSKLGNYMLQDLPKTGTGGDCFKICVNFLAGIILSSSIV